MTTTKTTAAKALEAAEGQHPKTGDRGLYDAAARNLVSVIMILAWIVKKCIREASPYSVREIAAKFIVGEPLVRKKAVYRDDAEAEDPGRAKMDQTEDTSIAEGTVRYDILFTLKLPGEEEPITVIVNVEVQNRTDLPYPLIARGVSYAARMLGSQGPNYGNLHKVYSIWIVSNPAKENENTVNSYMMASRTDGGALEEIENAGDLLEVVFLNLGEPESVQDPENPDILRLLDVLFSKNLTTEEKKNILETDFDIPMTKKMEEDMETMQAYRLFFEEEAEKRGLQQGVKQGLQQGIKQGLQQGIKEGEQKTLYSLVRAGDLSLSKAAERLGITTEQLKKDMQSISAE